MNHERSILEIGGADRLSFLQGIVTQDVSQLTPDTLRFSAILSPQGKLAHDFFMFAHGEGILLDVHAAHKDALLKRLAMYKLRANVTLRDASDAWQLAYTDTEGFVDPRHPDMPHRVYFQPPTPSSPALTLEDYHARRLALGIPETPYDTTPEDGAMDLGYDTLGAISFTKGCYVGQEVTARMHYKNIARRGFYIVTGASSDGMVMAGATAIGALRGMPGTTRLGLFKFETVDQAVASTQAFTVDNYPVSITLAPWCTGKYAQFQASLKNQ